jgi:hypothetical protein
MKSHHRLKPPVTCGQCEFFSQYVESLKTQSDFCEKYYVPMECWLSACSWRAQAQPDEVQGHMIKISQRLTEPKKRKMKHGDPRQDNLL